MQVLTRTRNVILAALLIGVTSLLGACAPKPEKKAEPELVASIPPPRPPEPALRAASDAHLTLFGELPDRSRVPFHAQASSPMKQHSFTTEGADFDVDISPDGQHVVFASTRHSAYPDLYVKTIDGRAVTQITSDPAPDVQPCFSPDGRAVIFASYRSGNWDLWIVGLNGGQATQITRSPMHEVHPSFASDGRRLVFCAFNEKADQWELWTMALDQPGSKRMVGVGLFPEWSPKADSIVFQRARERGGRWFSIWRIDLENGEPRFPIEVASSADMALIQPSWSPDGKWITYGTARLGTMNEDVATGAGSVMMSRGDVWIVAADGSSPLQLTDGSGAHFGSVWSRDGRVYFTSLQNGAENVWSVQPLQAPIAQASANTEDTNSTAANPAPQASPAEPSTMELSLDGGS